MQLSFWAWSSNLVLIRFIVYEILRCLYFGVLSWNCLFPPIWGGGWGMFPPNVVTHRSDPQKALPCMETRRLSHKAWKSVERFDLGASRKKGKDRTGQDSLTKKSQSGDISPIWGEALTVPIEIKICMERHLADIITCAVLRWNFQGLQFYRGSNFPFFLFTLHGPLGLTTAALLRCLWNCIS